MERLPLIAARVVLVICLAPTLTACHLPACADINYDAGERFQLTVVGRKPTVEPHCDFAPLAPGDVLTIVAGELATDSIGCGVRPARPEVPAFAKDVVSMCEAVPLPLGQQCRGTTSPMMLCTLETYVSAFIGRDDQRIEGTFEVRGSRDCAPNGYCRDSYAVHIERLPPG